MESFAHDGVCLQCGQDSPVVVQRAGSMLSRAFCGTRLQPDQEEHLFGLRTKDFNIIFFNFTTRVLFAQLITSFLLVWITLYLSDY